MLYASRYRTPSKHLLNTRDLTDMMLPWTRESLASSGRRTSQYYSRPNKPSLHLPSANNTRADQSMYPANGLDVRVTGTKLSTYPVYAH